MIVLELEIKLEDVPGTYYRCIFLEFERHWRTFRDLGRSVLNDMLISCRLFVLNNNAPIHDMFAFDILSTQDHLSPITT